MPAGLWISGPCTKQLIVKPFTTFGTRGVAAFAAALAAAGVAGAACAAGWVAATFFASSSSSLASSGFGVALACTLPSSQPIAAVRCF